MAFVSVSATLEDQGKALRGGAGVCELGDRAIVVRGEDRASVLAGMGPEDVKGLRPGQSRYAGAVNEKGKILGEPLARESLPRIRRSRPQQRGDHPGLRLPSRQRRRPAIHGRSQRARSCCRRVPSRARACS